MKFVPFAARAGKVMIVANNVTFIRFHENNQVKIGLIGGDFILVDGTVEEIAEKFMAA